MLAYEFLMLLNPIQCMWVPSLCNLVLTSIFDGFEENLVFSFLKFMDLQYNMMHREEKVLWIWAVAPYIIGGRGRRTTYVDTQHPMRFTYLFLASFVFLYIHSFG